MPRKKRIWWEKTVEYLYVCKYLGDYKMVVPLDGEHEKLSDSALLDGFRWIIVEFKKNYNWLSAEKNKFNKHEENRYDIAKKTLMEEYGDSIGIKHHFLVYGDIDNEGNLSLKTEQYFSTPKENVFEPNNLFKNGVSLSQFNRYASALVKFKSGSGGGLVGKSQADPDSPDDGGGLSISDYQSVIGVSIKNNEIICLTIEQFVQALSEEKDDTKLLTETLEKDIAEECF